MDAVYICRHGNNEELRFSIRSLENLKQVDNVILIGGKPNWYNGDYIPVSSSDKYTHAITNLNVLTKTHNISEEFILMNDDFYIMKPTDNLQYYNEGYLLNKIVKYTKFSPNSKYTNRLKQTHLFLSKRLGEEPLSYELHIPMMMTKTGLAEALKYDVLWRSYYGNMFVENSVETTDVKMYHPASRDPDKFKYDANPNTDFLSSEDRSFIYLRDRILKKLFPNASKYEE